MTKNIVLVALVAFVIWLAATGRLTTWFNMATQKVTTVAAA